MEQLTAGVRTAVDREPDPERQLAALVVHHVVMHALRPRETTLGDTELRSLTGERRDEVLRLRDEYESLVVQVLDHGAAAGRVPPARRQADRLRRHRAVHERRHLVP